MTHLPRASTRAWQPVFSLVGLSLASSSAFAHVCLEMPVSRAGDGCGFTAPQKVGPCGVAERSDKPTVFQPGETITVRINETVDHPSHYRIAFNPDGDDFEDPTSIDDNTGDHPHVLMDNIEDADEAVQEVEVTLPDVECENCTLQLIQVMYDKQLNGFGGNDGIPPDNNDLYYACADIALRAEGSDDAVDDEVDDAADDATDDEADDDVEQQASEDVEMSDAGMPSSSSSSPSGGSGRETCSIGRPAAGSAGVPWALLLALGFVWRARRASVARHGAGHDGYR